MYKDDPRVWNAIMNKVATEFQWLERYGIELSGNGRVYPIIVGNKGDWSYLVAWLTHLFDPFLGLTTPPIYNFPFPTKHLGLRFCLGSVWGFVAILRFLQETWSARTAELQRVPKRGGKTLRALAFVIYACVEPTLNGRICGFVPIV